SWGLGWIEVRAPAHVSPTWASQVGLRRVREKAHCRTGARRALGTNSQSWSQAAWPAAIPDSGAWRSNGFDSIGRGHDRVAFIERAGQQSLRGRISLRRSTPQPADPRLPVLRKAVLANQVHRSEDVLGIGIAKIRQALVVTPLIEIPSELVVCVYAKCQSLNGFRVSRQILCQHRRGIREVLSRHQRPAGAQQAGLISGKLCSLEILGGSALVVPIVDFIDPRFILKYDAFQILHLPCR